ncbi:MAG: UDP-N-acetylglucosamine 2-epimerase (non-hydrolyzing) [Candidatus Koribacter versatilis]|uniref:UDP-N-acetylglucosamine 2-epimerase (non-hydrolyzing) n=1 Tax=Candidatus Korobacter versatilis TaxID=658062 RepID=A0A932EQ78_9BACT|nr:UDP-N-acetylglucosamine 2-epimerase (non-hydrolyzing) [Candidatus Koribacter versatilis]
MSTPAGGPKKVAALVLGTRPEALKLVPVLRELRRHRDHLRTLVISTGQHREMLDQVLRPFDLSVDHDMSLMQPGQSLYALSSSALLAFEGVLAQFRPDLILVQGDTTTAFMGALAAYYAKLPVGHVEAGLRTYDKYSPFPEELDRRLISVVADLHFAPTSESRQNLLREGVPAANVFVTGNTAVDMLLAALEVGPGHRDKLPSLEGKRLVLVTIHRRESFGEGLREIFHALRDLAAAVPDALIFFPVHLNPNVRQPAQEILGSTANIVLTEPLDYLSFVHAMSRAELILTDSGGIQEEAPTLGVRVLVLRNHTERPEGLRIGTIQLAGTGRRSIVEHAVQALGSSARASRKPPPNPYGDGKASGRIVKQVLRFLGLPDQGIYSTLGEFRQNEVEDEAEGKR